MTIDDIITSVPKHALLAGLGAYLCDSHLHSRCEILEFLVGKTLSVGSLSVSASLAVSDLDALIDLATTIYSENLVPPADLHSAELATDSERGRIFNGLSVGNEFNGQILLRTLASLGRHSEATQALKIANFVLKLSERMNLKAETLFSTFRDEKETALLEVRSGIGGCVEFSVNDYSDIAKTSNCRLEWLRFFEMDSQIILPSPVWGEANFSPPILKIGTGDRVVARPTMLWPTFQHYLFTSTSPDFRSKFMKAYVALAEEAILKRVTLTEECAVLRCGSTEIRLVLFKFDGGRVAALFLLPDESFQQTLAVAGDVPIRLLHNTLGQALTRGYQKPDLVLIVHVGLAQRNKSYSTPLFENVPQLSVSAEELDTLLEANKSDWHEVYSLAVECADLSRGGIKPDRVLDLYELFWADGTLKNRLDFSWSEPMHAHLPHGIGREVRQRIKERKAFQRFLLHPETRVYHEAIAAQIVPNARASMLTHRTASGRVLKGDAYFWSEEAGLWVCFAFEKHTPRTLSDCYETFCQAILYWLTSLFRNAPSECFQKGTRIRLNLLEPDAWQILPVPESAHPVRVQSRRDRKHHEVAVTLAPAIQNLVVKSDGTADLAIMIPIVESLKAFTELDLSGVLEQLHKAVKVDGFHFLTGWKASDPRMADAGSSPFIPLGLSFKSKVLTDIGQYLLGEGYRSDSVQDDPTHLLNNVVSWLVQRVQVTLSLVNSSEAVAQVLEMHESHLCENRSLEARAPSLYEGRAEAELVERKLLATEACLASRCLLEFMAACPGRGSRRLPDHEIQHLLSLCHWTINLGMASTVHHSKVGTAQLSLTPSGVFKCSSNIWQKLQEHRGETLIPTQTAQRAKTNFSEWMSRMNPLFETELGLTLEQIAMFSDHLGRLAESGIVSMSRQKVKQDLECLFSPQQVDSERFLSNWSLRPRDRLLEAPEGFSNADTQPWRFNRKLSYLSRPLIQVGSNVIWGSMSVRFSGMFMAHQVFEGRFRASSPAMKNLITDIEQERGKVFNDSVYERLLAAGGSNLIIRKNVLKLSSSRLRGKDNQDLGDIDVLCISQESKTVWLLECKSILPARTPMELVAETEKLFTGKKNFLQKSEARKNWIEQNFDRLISEFNLDGARGDWRIEHRIVTEVPSLAALIASEGHAVCSVKALIELIRDKKSATNEV